MHVVHTAGLPPNQGRMNFPMSGCTWESRKAPVKMVRAKAGMRLNSTRMSHEVFLHDLLPETEQVRIVPIDGRAHPVHVRVPKRLHPCEVLQPAFALGTKERLVD